VLVREVIPTALPPKGKAGDSTNNSLVKGALEDSMIEAPVAPHEKNPRIHPLLSKLILDCVEIELDRRPPTMHDVLERLGLVADVLNVPETEEQPTPDDSRV